MAFHNVYLDGRQGLVGPARATAGPRTTHLLEPIKPCNRLAEGLGLPQASRQAPWDFLLKLSRPPPVHSEQANASPPKSPPEPVPDWGPEGLFLPPGMHKPLQMRVYRVKNSSQ